MERAGTVGVVACPVCDSPDFIELYDLSRQTSCLNIPGKVVRCDCCKLRYKVPAGAIDFTAIYGSQYHAAMTQQSYLSGWYTPLHFNKIAKLLRKLVTTPGASLLDVGAAEGALVRAALEVGFDARGIELCREHVDAAKRAGIPVDYGDVTSLIGKGRFDVITLTDLVEHLERPVEVLSCLVRDLLKPGGILLVGTPNHNALVVKLAEFCHRLGWCGPVQEIFGSNHLCFFTVSDLLCVMQRSGIEPMLTRLRPYNPLRPGGPVSVISLFAISVLELIGWPLGMSFRLQCIGRKVV